jgi:uncharacterized short protein YbdD (DUF466 family)
MMQSVVHSITRCWQVLRELAGDDAYERYREHHVRHHPHESPLDRRSYYLQSQREKWNGIKRCC